MVDGEKVIKGLEVCTSKPCYCIDCPYKSNCCLDSQEVMEDALALLKEQKEQIKNRDESLEKAREEIKWLRGMLKAQEAKTGHWIDSAGNDKCSICGEEYSDLYPDYGNTHFCPNCGAKMESR